MLRVGVVLRAHAKRAVTTLHSSCPSLLLPSLQISFTPTTTERSVGTTAASVSRIRSLGTKTVPKPRTESDSSLFEYAPLLQSSLIRSLPYLLIRAHGVGVEAWLPNEDESAFEQFEGSTYISKDSAAQLNRFTATTAEESYPNDGKSNLSKAWRNCKSVEFEDVEAEFTIRGRIAKSVGIKNGLIVPVSLEGKPFALLRFYSLDSLKHINSSSIDNGGVIVAGEQKKDPKDHSDIEKFASGIVTAGVYRKGSLPEFNENPLLVPPRQMQQVYERIVNEEVFNANLVYHEVDWFYNLGLQKYYFERFSAVEIANHVHAFMAAKKVAATTGKPEDIMLQIENSDERGDGSMSFLYMCAIEHGRQVDVEKRIQQQIHKFQPTTGSGVANKAYSLEFFMSAKPIVSQGKKQLGLYVLESSEWAVKDKVGNATEANIKQVASVTFLRTKTPLIQERYQTLLSSTVSKISPVAQVFPVYRDGTIPIMFSFYQSAGTTTSYMLQLTELLKHNSMTANRKYIETFANGIIVFSLYLHNPVSKQQIDALLKQFSMLHLTPESSLTKQFLSGEYSAEQYTYNSAASRFVYYFLNKRTEEFDVLAKALNKDALNLGRLRLLQTRLKREAVSQERIYSCLANHQSVAIQLFNDFHHVATCKASAEEPTGMARLQSSKLKALLAKIKNEATTVLDEQILMALLIFNCHLLKTNFYTNSKAALSFRLDPSFLFDSDWPLVPFGLFFVMGSDFQGFHIRFRDIARGGIRVIRSGDRQAYNSNLETLFQENYGLAFTQNKKNKDIPEFGSKGTILLYLNNQSTPFLAFQKYVSGLLDLMIANKDIVDNFGREEILFLGPDEGTADYMEWAARYAAKRGYRYWRSFTTGKPLSLGGIPHDRFGMTTCSVHRYVLGCLRKAGLQEDQVMKFQTGGPDGDLGSNEILISKDKTKAIVDGSGVVYDPKGLDRTELKRLATKRAMIKEFDTSKLGQGGFRVLVTDTNITLPSGEHVQSGLAFRNEFHLHPLSSADLFVPCGGRPESVNLTNVNKMFDSKGLPRFKIIVEGANLFFTQDARLVLENAGVILYKDASANKGGVTSSSLEVLVALALSNEQFDQHMTVKTDKQGKEIIPEFYKDYVAEIQQRIEADADLEFECIWREHERTKTHRYLLTDAVSDKISKLNDYVQTSSLWTNIPLRNRVLSLAIPKKLQQLVGLQEILKRVPESYTQAIFGAYLASRYVYKHGLDANEFEFFEFMQPFIKDLKQ